MITLGVLTVLLAWVVVLIVAIDAMDKTLQKILDVLEQRRALRKFCKLGLLKQVK